MARSGLIKGSRVRKAAASLLLLTVSAALATGCAERVKNYGRFIEPGKLDDIKVGETTEDQVMDSLGSPTATGTFDANRWYYIGQKMGYRSIRAPELLERDVIVITFNADKVVSDVKHLDAADGEKVNLIEQETPTSGKTLGFFEQLIGNVGRFAGSKQQ